MSISHEMGIEMTRWVLGMIGKQGPIEVLSGIFYHNSINSEDVMCKNEYDKLEEGENIMLGEKDKIVTIEDCFNFLHKLEKYANNPVFDNGRSYIFEGIVENEQDKEIESYVILWGS